MLSSGHHRGARAGRDDVGTARRDDSRPLLAGPGKAGRGARPARPDLRLVRRGLRHAGPARGESAAQRTPVVPLRTVRTREAVLSVSGTSEVAMSEPMPSRVSDGATALLRLTEPERRCAMLLVYGT